MIIYLPLEELPQRYNVMMNEAIRPHVDVVVMPLAAGYDRIENGQFLDVTKTIGFKAQQLAMVSAMFTAGEVKDGDTFLIGDIFFPGIESIRYMAELLGIKIKMFGFNYAGRADSEDFVRKLGRWADVCEAGYHEVMDGVFVGSQFHKQNVLNYFRLPEKMVHVTGYIWDVNYIGRTLSANEIYPEMPFTETKEPYCIWPHRIAQEKGWSLFLQIAALFKEIKFKVTTCGNAVDVGYLPPNVEYFHNLSKRQYYEIFKEAKYYLSTASQETFGYTLQEAIYFGCRIAVPAQACYPEMVPQRNTYRMVGSPVGFMADQIQDCWKSAPPELSLTYRWDGNIHKVLKHLI